MLADLRVDDHPDAPAELARIHALHTLYFDGPEDLAPLEVGLRDEVAGLLRAVQARTADEEPVEASLERWMEQINLETRHVGGGINGRVLEELRRETAERSGA